MSQTLGTSPQAHLQIFIMIQPLAFLLAFEMPHLSLLQGLYLTRIVLPASWNGSFFKAQLKCQRPFLITLPT